MGNRPLEKGDRIRLEEGGAWHIVVRVTPAAAYVKSEGNGETRTFLVHNRTVKTNGLEYEVPLAEPKEITVPVRTNVIAISRCSFVVERS